MTEAAVPPDPRPSSTVCALRPAAGGAEVLMVRRAGRSSFMGGTWVFPGGVVDPVDHSDLAIDAVATDPGEDGAAWRAAALRELAEEASVWITDGPLPTKPERVRDAAVYRAVVDRGVRFDGRRLHYFANWVTPAQVPVRFDTRFYVAWVTAGTVASADRTEIEETSWVRPCDAMERGARGEWDVPFPTMRALEVVAGFTDPDVTASRVAGIGAVPRIEPRIALGDDGSMRVVLPDDGDYDVVRPAPAGSVVAPGEVR